MFPCLLTPAARRYDSRQVELSALGAEVAAHFKSAGVPEKSFALSGRLYLSRSGWLLCSVPNAVVRGFFDAITEPGWELPYKDDGTLEAHISVAHPDELMDISQISERGHTYKYSITGLQEVVPDGWPEYGRVLMLVVDSPELRALRKSYGLEPLRKGYAMHITVARKRKKVTQENDVRKVADAKNKDAAWTYVPTSALDSVRSHGLYSGQEILKRPAIARLIAQARGVPEDRFKSDIERVLAGWKPDSAKGPNVVWRRPPEDAPLAASHPLKTWDLTPIRIRLSALLRDMPQTRIHGQELTPYREDSLPEERHRDLSMKDVERYRRISAKRLWSKYVDIENRGMYAPNVPHAAVITPTGNIPTKYLIVPDKEKTANLPVIIENPRGSYKRFRDPEHPQLKDYPIEGVTYPVDYGYLPGYLGEDESDLDFFVGSDPGGLSGRMRVYRPDVPGGEETKFYHRVSPEERTSVLNAFARVLRGEAEDFSDATALETALKSYAIQKKK